MSRKEEDYQLIANFSKKTLRGGGEGKGFKYLLIKYFTNLEGHWQSQQRYNDCQSAIHN